MTNEKSFDNWDKLKKELHFKGKRKFFREKEIYFISIGQNIGYEIFGKKKEFLRPVLIYKKLSHSSFLGIPLASKQKEGSYYFQFLYKKNRISTALLNQIRVFDSRRIKYFSGQMKNEDFEKLQEKLISFIKITPSQRKGGILAKSEQRKDNGIISQKDFDVNVRKIDNKYLNKQGKIKDEYKFKINIPEFGIIDSKIPAKDNEKFNTYLFLPENENRKGEGGLRTKGYLKKSIDNKPLISIITVVYNGEKYLEETIKSAINQSYSNIEYIIIDGGSTDGTIDIIKKYEDKIDYWVSEKDEGISDAFNKGLKVSLGEYIQILNAGDFLIDDNILDKIAPNLLLNEDVVAYQSRTDTGNNFPFYANEYTKIKPLNPNEALNNAMIAHQGSFIKRDVYKKIGFYKKEFKLRMDFELFVRLEQYFKIKCVNEPIIIYDTQGISSNILNRLNFKLEELKIINLYYNDPLFNIRFYLELPFYLFKKLLSHFYYKLKGF